MTKQIRITLVTSLFFFGLLTGLQAQDKYEYAVITYRTYGRELGVSINGKEFKKIELGKAEKDYFIDANPALEEVNKMSSDGWELFDTGTPAAGVYLCYVFYLRKKVG